MSLEACFTCFRGPHARVALAAALLAAAMSAPGCREEEAPPAALAPAPVAEAVALAPAPVVLTPEEVSARLRPLFAALYEHGFATEALSSPVRSAAPTVDNAAPPQPLAATPRGLTPRVDKECEAAGIDAAVVEKCVADLRRALTGPEAHDKVLAIYATQAIHDADTGNLHRAHVLFSDTLRELSDSRSDDLTTALILIRQLFQDVPHEASLRAFGEQLERYMLLRGQECVLRGEHAAVLHAGGLTDAAASARRRLLADIRLVTLPLVDLAIARGDTYGWQPTPQVEQARDRLLAHAAALAEGHSPSTAFLDDVKWRDTETEQAAVMAAAKAFPAIVMAGCPLRYDGEQQRLSMVGIKSLTADERLTAAAEWTAGKAGGGAQATDGTGHFLLALHWLSLDRTDTAQAALQAGAAALLEAVRVEAAGDSDDEAAVATMLCRQLNACRLLAAATIVSSGLPGEVAGVTATRATEIEVFLLAWRHAWLKAGLPLRAADGVIADAMRALEQRAAGMPRTADGPLRRPDRYFFFDYRFLGDGVPEVMVAKAAAEELVEKAKQPELASSARFLEFLSTFELPREFSPGFRTRLQAETPRVDSPAK